MVAIEPIPANNGLLIQDPSFLQGVRDLCDKYGVLLLFDEVISDSGWPSVGQPEYYGIRPDVMAFGKIIGGGMPVGAYAASADIMDHVAPVGPGLQAAP